MRNEALKPALSAYKSVIRETTHAILITTSHDRNDLCIKMNGFSPEEHKLPDLQKQKSKEQSAFRRHQEKLDTWN